MSTKQLNKKVLLLVVYSIAFISVAYSQHILVKDGKVSAVIVVSQKAPEPVKFAGKELSFFIEKITGQKIPIIDKVPENKTTTAIILGENFDAKKAGIKSSELKRDGYIIQSVDNKIFIVGKDSSGEEADIEKKLDEIKKTSSYKQLKILMSNSNWSFERGTLYGVYRFLEELGTRWFFPGEKGTIIPHVTELSVKTLNIKEEPSFLTRQIGLEDKRPLNLREDEYKFDQSEFQELEYTPANNILWALRQRTSSFSIPLTHMPPRVAWDMRFKDHPEYFALLENGKRDIDLTNPKYRSHQCYSNLDVMKIIIGDIEAYRGGKTPISRGIPQDIGWSSEVFNGKFSSVLPHDSFRACYCEKCKLLLPSDGTDALAQHSRQVWSFVDRCGRELQEKIPDHKITCLAYSSYSLPYEKMPKLPNNVIVGICPGIYKKPEYLTKENNYQKLMDIIQTWRDVSSSPHAYWLHYLYRFRQPQRWGVPMHLPHLVSKLWKDLAKDGKWIFVEEDKDSIMFEHLNRYIMMKLSYSPETDIDALLNDYYEKFYGPKAAPVMKKIFDDIEKQCTEIGKTNAGQINIWEQYFGTETLKNYVLLIEEALKLASGTEYEKNVNLFSKYYLLRMQNGYDDYNRNVKSAIDAKGTNVSMRKATSPIKIDGAIDEETWNEARTLTMRNNVDGKKTNWLTKVKILQDVDNLYFAFICHDPETMKRSEEKGKTDSIEIFLDPDHSHNAYYHIWIDMAGRITDTFYEGNGELGQDAWDSRTEFAIKKYEDHWIVEIVVPRTVFNNKFKNRPVGANFCRTMLTPPDPKDRFSCWSPLLIGQFHQPDLFGHLWQ